MMTIIFAAAILLGAEALLDLLDHLPKLVASAVVVAITFVLTRRNDRSTAQLAEADSARLAAVWGPASRAERRMLARALRNAMRLTAHTSAFPDR